MHSLLNKTVVLIVASQGYQATEYEVPKKILSDAGVKVVTASNKPGVAGEGRTSTIVDLTVREINPQAYDGFFIIGGPGALANLDNQDTHRVMQEAVKNKKLIGAICISPRILAHAGLLTGKRVAGWNTDGALPGILAGIGATFVNEKVVVDGMIITASGPMAAAEFGKAIVEKLKG